MEAGIIRVNVVLLSKTHDRNNDKDDKTHYGGEAEVNIGILSFHSRSPIKVSRSSKANFREILRIHNGIIGLFANKVRNSGGIVHVSEGNVLPIVGVIHEGLLSN